LCEFLSKAIIRSRKVAQYCEHGTLRIALALAQRRASLAVDGADPKIVLDGA